MANSIVSKNLTNSGAEANDFAIACTFVRLHRDFANSNAVNDYFMEASEISKFPCASHCAVLRYNQAMEFANPCNTEKPQSKADNSYQPKEVVSYEDRQEFCREGEER